MTERSKSADHREGARERAIEPAPDARLLGQILEVMPNGIVHVAPDGAIRLANEEAREFLGLSWDEIGERYVNDFEGDTFHEDGSPCPVEEYPVTRCLMTGEPQGPKVIGVQQPSGDLRWGIFTALPTAARDGEDHGAVVTFVDISDRRWAELRSQAERQLLDAARMVHFDDHPDTTVAVFHEPLERFLELTGSGFGFIARVDPEDPIPEELPVLVSLDHDHPVDFRRSLPPVPIDPLSQRCLRERRPLLLTDPAPPGGPFGERAPGHALLYPLIAGERTLGLVVLADAPKAYDAAQLEYLAPLFHACADLLGALGERSTRTRLEAQLARAERLASVGTLAAGMAHEINNPLAYVLLNLEACRQQTQLVSRTLDRYQRALMAELGAERARALLDEQTLPAAVEALRRHTQDATDGAQRVERIVKDLMTFSRVSEPHRGLVDVNASLQIALKMADHEIKYRARLVSELGDISPVVGHDGRLSQVFLNLLLNAARAIDEGSPDANEIRVRTWEAGGRVRVEVSDTGCGIDPEHLHRLFEPFFTTRAGSGTGLGLSICHSVISAHDGTIDVESEPGRGTRFHVTLPAARRGSVRRARRKKLSSPALSQTRERQRMLLVDDEAMVLRVLGQLLGRRFEVATADGYESAVELLERGERFDLVLCDMMMLDGTGMDLHDWIAEHRPELMPGLVFMTGGTFTPKARDFLHDVARHHLKKPFSLKELDEVLGAVSTR